mgnify:CR=1 FL=1
MSNIIPGNKKHLTLKNRIYIEDSLNQGLTFKEIAEVVANVEKTWTKYTVTFEEYEGDAEHIAIKVNNKYIIMVSKWRKVVQSGRKRKEVKFNC